MKTSIGSTIKRYRKAAKLTQKQLAERLNKAESTVRMWELEKSTPSLDTIKNIGKILNIPLGDLLLNAGYIDEFKEMVKENLSKPLPIPTFGEAIQDARSDWTDDDDSNIFYDVPLEEIATKTGIPLKKLENLEKNINLDLVSAYELLELSKALDVVFAYLYLLKEKDLGNYTFSVQETEKLLRSLHGYSYNEMTFVKNNSFEEYLKKQKCNDNHDDNFWLSIYEDYKEVNKINNLVMSYAFSKQWNETNDIRYLINNDFIDMYYDNKKLSRGDKEKIVEAIQKISSDFEYMD